MHLYRSQTVTLCLRPPTLPPPPHLSPSLDGSVERLVGSYSIRPNRFSQEVEALIQQFKIFSLAFSFVAKTCARKT